MAALLSSSPAPAQSPFDRCSDIGPGALAQIEVLPAGSPLVLRGDTCTLSPTLDRYTGPCGIAQVPYPGKDAIYEVRLHEGNRVGFRLRPVSGPGGPPDLMLALLSQCGEPDSCVVNSPDFIGPGSEELPPQRYKAGVYYLYVDSASLEADSCGAYTLTVEGTNPTPDLRLSLAGSPDPVVAGEHLTYRVVVSNEGTLEATEVEVVVDVPEETSLEGRDPRCELDGPRTVRCPIRSLPVGASELWLLRVRVAPSARGTLTARAKVRAIEGLPDHANAVTEVEARADLSLVKSASSSRVVAGTPLDYLVQVTNHGPSDSAGGEVLDDLPPGLAFVSSPSGCVAAGRRVRCPFGPVPVGRTATLRFAAQVGPEVTAEVSNTAVVVPLDPDPGPRPNAGSVATPVGVETDLGVTKWGPATVVAGETLVYALEVTNHGPSDSPGATVTDVLPIKVAFEGSEDGCEAVDNARRRVRCPVGPIPARGTSRLQFRARVEPSRLLPLKNQARVAAAHDFEPDNDESEPPVASAIEVESALVLCNVAPLEVFRGATSLHRLTVTNRGGPSDWPGGGDVVASLSPGLVCVPSRHCSCDPGGSAVRCPLRRIPVDAGQEILFFAAVEAQAPEEVEVVATLEPPAGRDDRRVRGNGQDEDCRPPSDGMTDSTETASTVLEGPHLVLPYFEVDRDPSGAATLFSVRSLAGDPIGFRIDYYSAAGSPLHFEEGQVLGPKALRTIHLRDVLRSVPKALLSGPGPVTGYAWITATDLLAGDFFQLEPGSGSAHGGLLLSTDRERVPAELCGEWSVRFTEEEPFDGGTDFVVWVTEDLNDPGAEPTDPAPGELTSVAYDRAGVPGPSNTIQVPTSQAAFTRSFRELFGHDPPAAGTVEWTFPEGLVGNVAAVHRSTGSSSVRVPGVCRDRPARGRPPGTNEPLVLPYFEVDPAEGGTTTLLAVRNEGDAEVEAAFEYFDAAGGGPLFEETCTLPSRGLRTVDLHRLGLAQEAGCTEEGEPSGLSTGFVEVRTVEPDTLPAEGEDPPETFLSGDYARLDPASRQAAGAALLDTDTSASPSARCQRWSTRVLHGGGLETDFIVYAPPEGDAPDSAPAAAWTLRDTQGRCLAGGDEGPCPAVELELPGVASQVASGDLLAWLATPPKPDDLGSVEWDLLDRRGNVSTRFRADLGGGRELSILVPGVCLDEPEPPDEATPDS